MAITLHMRCTACKPNRHLVWQVVLPEGSTVKKVKAPFHVEESADTKYTYLDTDGRPVVVIRKKNVVFEHNVAFAVEYTFSAIHLVQTHGPAHCSKRFPLYGRFCPAILKVMTFAYKAVHLIICLMDDLIQP